MEGKNSFNTSTEQYSTESISQLYKETMGLLGNLQQKGNVDIEKDLINAMNKDDLTNNEKYELISSINRKVFEMIYGEGGRSSDYR